MLIGFRREYEGMLIPKSNQKWMVTSTSDVLQKVSKINGKNSIIYWTDLNLKPKMECLFTSIFDGFSLVLGGKIEPRANKIDSRHRKNDETNMRFGSPWWGWGAGRAMAWGGSSGPLIWQVSKKPGPDNKAKKDHFYTPARRSAVADIEYIENITYTEDIEEYNI